MFRSYFEKRKPFLLIIVSITFFTLAHFYASFYKANQKAENLIPLFTQKLNNRIDKAEFLLNELARIYPNPKFEDLKKFESKLPNNFSLFVFMKSNLIYWSDNLINPNITLLLDSTKSRILQSGNGVYQTAHKKSGEITYIIVDLIKSGYSYRNDYLSPVFNSVYEISPEYEIEFRKIGTPVVDREGRFLFSLEKKDKSIDFSEQFTIILYLLYLTGYIILVLALFSLYKLVINLKKNPWTIILFIFDIIIIRVVLIHFRIPESLYSTELFSPINFAYSRFLPSLGDFFTDSLVSALAFYLIFKILNSINFNRSASQIKNLIISLVLTSVLVFFFYLLCYLLDILINNSSFNLDLSNTTDLSKYSLMAYFIVFFILLTYFFISYALYKIVISYSGWIGAVIIFIIINLFFYFLTLSSQFYIPQKFLHLFHSLYFACLILIFIDVIRFPHFSSISILILLLTMISSYSFYINKSQKEKNERILIALRLSSDRDKMGEFLFAEKEKLISSDSTFHQYYLKAWADPQFETKCTDYIKNKYFKGYWSVYNIQITLCFQDKSLQIRPSNYIIGCQQYFNDIINRLGEPTSSPFLYFIRESYDASSYIASIPIVVGEPNLKSSYLVIELSPKYVPKGLGYPELLMDKTRISQTDISDYSYAIFYKDELVKNVGEYNFGVNESKEIQTPADLIFYDKNGYNHLHHIVNEDTCVIISKRNLGILDTIAPFTYQLIFHIILLLIVAGIFNFKNIGRKKSFDFKTRLQLMVVFLVLFASISVGITTLNNIRNLNDKKNRDMLSEKAHSVLIELEHKLASLDIIDKSQKSYLEELLTKFSLVFFSDINLYDINGKLLASSRPQIFTEGLKSELMGPLPFEQLSINKRNLFIGEEKIGNYKYLSAYLPFRNEQNKLTAYINLPYFAREQELRQEISTFLVAFINIYVILTVLAVLISILAGNYLMRPLQIIRKRFSIINFGQTNEKITYNRKDELGDLINEYNQMIDKLAESAEKLARSERESAWREMARQVAHEIKNPLTPMKLSIQHLRKSWNDKTPDWETKLEKTTQTLIEQIDSLASIATAFSDFAKLPTQSNKKTELTGIIRKTIALFNQHPNINFSFTLPDKLCFVFADEKQLSRVFINLFNNAVQAISPKNEGLVNVKLTSSNKLHRIEISDNGTGIDEEKQSKIFSPNFTTKSGGMGLGLAMVKNIIDSTGGEISFISQSGTGTTFIIELPVMAE